MMLSSQRVDLAKFKNKLISYYNQLSLLLLFDLEFNTLNSYLNNKNVTIQRQVIL